ncbi:hypothetical protein ASF56_23670 [Methylobacterium sp. Leaf122]|nr:hypothetical protein ASF56_23670 [Methylobacterium sp. Leaf122]
MVDPPVIAIVDDDNSVREAMSGLVRSLGYVTRSYSSAIDFLRAGVADETSCVITDMQMPGMDGTDLQHALRDAGRSVPIIVVTGFLTDAVRARALEAGAWDVFRKPCDGAALGRSLETALNRQTRA